MKTLLLSAGHYPAEKGACYKDFCEHDKAVKWVRLVQDNLDGLCKVVPVPGVRLVDKVNFVNRHHGDLALEIHFNACGGCGAKGSESLYMPSSVKGQLMARIIQEEISKVFSPSRGVKEGWYKQDRPGVIDYQGDVDGDEKPDYFLKKTRWPAVIVEPEFIHNEERIVSNREAGCKALATSIMDALGAA